MLYLVNYYGDLEGGNNKWDKNPTLWEADGKAFRSLDDALAAISKDFPLTTPCEGEEDCRETPDPEDDRIVVWELAEGESMKAVWAFCGWHWSIDELGLKEQGCLPGDIESLYGIACT